MELREVLENIIMRETFWGIFLGFIGGAVLTVIGSATIGWLQEHAEANKKRQFQKSHLKDWVLEAQNLREFFEKKSELSKNRISSLLSLFEIARESGAVSDLPKDVQVNFINAKNDLIALGEELIKKQGDTTLTGRVTFPGYSSLDAYKSLEDSLPKAVSSLKTHLKSVKKYNGISNG